MNRNIQRTSYLVPLLGALFLLTRLDDAAMLLAPGGQSAATGMAWAAAPETVLPPGVKAVWDLETAQREKTPTRKRVCLNGLWRWQPAKDAEDAVPADRWGYFKVPGFWPGRSSYDQEDCQTLYSHPSWKDEDLRGLTAAWYQREITVPEDWSGRRITVQAEYVNSYVIAFVDGKKAGEIRFPAGEVDLSARCAGRERRTSSVSSSSPCRSREFCSPTPTPIRPGKSRARWSGAGCAATCTSSAPLGRAHQRPEDRHVGSQRGDHGQRGAGRPRGGCVLRPSRRNPGRGPRRPTVREQALQVRRPGRRPHRRRREVEARKALGRQLASKRLHRAGFPAGTARQAAGRRPARALRVPRVLDRRPGFLPERHAHLPLRRAAGQRPARARSATYEGRARP